MKYRAWMTILTATMMFGCSDATEDDSGSGAECDREPLQLTIGEPISLGGGLTVAVPQGAIEGEGTLGTRCLNESEMELLPDHDEGITALGEPFVFETEGFTVEPPLYGLIFLYETAESVPANEVLISVYSTSETVTDYDGPPFWSYLRSNVEVQEEPGSAGFSIDPMFSEPRQFVRTENPENY